MNITIGHVIAYALDARFGADVEYFGPHKDIGKNIELINKILAEFRYNQPVQRTQEDGGRNNGRNKHKKTKMENG